jgi:hypothetical protein
MSATVDQFCDRLRNQLNAIERRFESFKADMQSLPEKAETAVRGKLEKTRRRLKAQKDRIDQTWAKLKAMAQPKVTDTKVAVNEWKEKRETQKLQARADRADAYAAATIDHAVASIDEVQDAMLYAAVARLDADSAK